MLELITIIAIILLDQAVKLWSDTVLVPLGTSKPLIEGVFHFTSAHNTGAAWGMMKGMRWFFIVLTVVIVIGMVVFVIRYRKKLHWSSRLTLALMLAGAVGNLIDRILFGYVRDMFYFILIDFPIFNVADSALCVGCGLLMLDILFKKEQSILSLEVFEKDKKQDADGVH